MRESYVRVVMIHQVRPDGQVNGRVYIKRLDGDGELTGPRWDAQFEDRSSRNLPATVSATDALPELIGMAQHLLAKGEDHGHA